MAESVKRLTLSIAVVFACLVGVLTVLPALGQQVFRDPTQPPKIDNRDGNDYSANGPVLQSVLISPGRRIAIISSQTVRLGEKFGSAQLVKVSETEVVLRNGQELQILKLSPGVDKHLSSNGVDSNSAIGSKKGRP